jgi:hypothetical protein
MFATADHSGMQIVTRYFGPAEGSHSGSSELYRTRIYRITIYSAIHVLRGKHHETWLAPPVDPSGQHNIVPGLRAAPGLRTVAAVVQNW